ncbi:MAG: transposase [Syntrophales bacterium]|nr:transposase [Syntrophales bacterium]MCK9528722.1 transposase [Syntrophales bacterium]MDX9922987.1 transposase [Syntrophales bacterium]
MGITFEGTKEVIDFRMARSALKTFAHTWGAPYPKAAAALQQNEEELLVFMRIAERSVRPTIRTTNAIERRFREVKRRTRPMGVFADTTSMERILYAVFAHENMKQQTGTPFLTEVTQNS